MKKILLAGFEKFGVLNSNPSELITKRVATPFFQNNFLNAEWDVRSHILPVEEDAVDYAEFLSVIANNKPQVVLIFGVAVGRALISIEEFTYNRLVLPDRHTEDYKPIYAGLSPHSTQLCTIDTLAIVGSLRKNGIPSELSRDPGLYFCNYAAHRVANLAHSYSLPLRFGLIHLPVHSEEVAANPKLGRTPSLPLRTLIDAAEIICKHA